MADDSHEPSAVALEDIVIPQGASESGTWPTPWWYAEGEPLGIPAGWPDAWVGRMQIREYRGGPALATLHSSDPDADGTLTLDTITDDDTDYAQVVPYVDPAVSAAWDWADLGELVWDLELTDGARVIRLVEGAVSLSGEVTVDA